MSGVSFFTVPIRSSTQNLMMSTFFAASSSTAWRASAAVVTQWGAVVRPGSGPVMPRHVGRVLPQAQRRADAVERATLEIIEQHLACLAQMSVRIDDRRHHSFAGQIHASRASRNRDVACAPNLRDPRAVNEEDSVLDGCPVPDDDARAL